MNLFAWWNSGEAVLRYYRAVEVDAHSHPAFYRVVAGLVQRSGLPMPRVYVIDNPQPNAFATGRGPENAAVAATTGLLRNLNEQEVAGVMAHELAHVRNRDTLIMTVAATIAGAISMLANFALFFGNNRNNPLGIVGVLATMILANTRPAAAAPKSAASRCGWPARSPNCSAAPRRSTTTPPNTIPRPPICSSSIRYMCTASTGCSRPTRRPRSASRGCRRWRPRRPRPARRRPPAHGIVRLRCPVHPAAQMAAHGIDDAIKSWNHKIYTGTNMEFPHIDVST